MAGETITAQLRGFNPQGLGAPIIVIMMLAMVVIPLPPMALDMLFTFNISLAKMSSSGVALLTVLADDAVVRQTGCSVFASRQKKVCAILLNLYFYTQT